MNAHIDAAKPTILVFCRPFLMRDVMANLAPLQSDYAFSFVTDGPYPGVNDTRCDFYGALRSAARSDAISAEEEADIVARCRLLRSIDRPQALRLLHAMAITLCGVLDKVQPMAVFGQMVDEYITHLLSLLANKRGLKFAGYAHSYFPGHAQVVQNAYGAPLRSREPDDAEVSEILALITQQAFRQNYQQTSDYTWPLHFRKMARYQLKRFVFAARKILNRDPWNSHFSLLPHTVEYRYFRDFPRREFFHADWRDELAKRRAARPRAPVIYLPLGYFPESTIDYWVADTRALQFERLTIEMLRSLSRDFVVVVKEHLHMMGGRDAGFLKTLRAISDIVNVHPLEFSNDVLEQSDAVILGGGSVGVEATIRGKPVFSYCDTCYWFPASGAHSLRLADIDLWPQQVTAGLASHSPLGQRQIFEFVRDCLRGNVRMRPGGRKWPLMDERDMRSLFDVLIRKSRAPTSVGSAH